MIAPLLFWIAGIVLIVIYAPKTTYVNGMVGLGFGILCVSTYWALFLFHKEYDMTGRPWPFPLKQRLSELYDSADVARDRASEKTADEEQPDDRAGFQTQSLFRGGELYPLEPIF